MIKVCALFLSLVCSVYAQNEMLLWDDNMPGSFTTETERVEPNNRDDVIRLTNVSQPTLNLYLVESNEPTPFVIVCPGGGYRILAYNTEGTEVAEWLNRIGVSAAVLKYRVPQNREGALEDARRSVRLVRQHSKAWGVDPEKIGMLGFSAGGHLTAACSNSEDRPDFSVLVYPAYLFQSGGIELTSEISVDVETPPAFIVQTRDDRKYYRSTLAYAAALDAKEIPVEVHLFAEGGHGYGLRPSKYPVSGWPALCESWMRASGFLKD